MKVMNKKKPADYPVLRFRVSEQEHAEISEMVDQVVELLKKRSKEPEPVVLKGAVAVEALRRGLKSMMGR